MAQRHASVARQGADPPRRRRCDGGRDVMAHRVTRSGLAVASPPPASAAAPLADLPLAAAHRRAFGHRWPPQPPRLWPPLAAATSPVSILALVQLARGAEPFPETHDAASEG